MGVAVHASLCDRWTEGKTPTPFEKDTVVEEASWPKSGTRKRKQVFPKVRVTIE